MRKPLRATRANSARFAERRPATVNTYRAAKRARVICSLPKIASCSHHHSSLSRAWFADRSFCRSRPRPRPPCPRRRAAPHPGHKSCVSEIAALCLLANHTHTYTRRTPHLLATRTAHASRKRSCSKSRGAQFRIGVEPYAGDALALIDKRRPLATLERWDESLFWLIAGAATRRLHGTDLQRGGG